MKGFSLLASMVVGQQVLFGVETELAQATNRRYTSEEIDGFLEDYDDKFSIPIKKANYTDSNGHIHPLWSAPFFDHELK